MELSCERPQNMNPNRKIIHVDMDAFYASVEQRDNPSLRGKPVIVGGSPKRRGVVAAASYEARTYGIRSALSAARAYELCPHAIFLKPRFSVYREVSATIMQILRQATQHVEPLSLDEAYLDVTENNFQLPLARDVAAVLKQQIEEQTGLTASAGVAPNKFLAKIASDMNKPDGLTVIHPDRVQDVLSCLAVRKVPGVGRVTEERLAQMGITTVSELRQFSLEDLSSRFGKQGHWFYSIARGIDNRMVISERQRRSLSSERTFFYDVRDIDELIAKLHEVCDETFRRVEQKQLMGRTIVLKVTYADFSKITRSRTRDQSISSIDELRSIATTLLLHSTEAGERPIRLLGVGLSHFEQNDDEEDADQRADPQQLALPFKTAYEPRTNV